jgi:hypothetical protein
MTAETTNNKGDNDFMEGVTNMLSYFEGMILDEFSELRQDIFGDDDCDENIEARDARNETNYIVAASNVDEGTVSTMSATSRKPQRCSSTESSVTNVSSPPIPTAIYFRPNTSVGDSSKKVTTKKPSGGFRGFSHRLRQKRFLPHKKTWGTKHGKYKSRRTWTNTFALRRQSRAPNYDRQEI